MFKLKYNSDDIIKRYKIKLTIQRFAQRHEINYIEIFALIIRCKSRRIFLAIVTIMSMIFIQIDMVKVYLKSLFD